MWAIESYGNVYKRLLSCCQHTKVHISYKCVVSYKSAVANQVGGRGRGIGSCPSRTGSVEAYLENHQFHLTP